ncbi:MAG: CHC2 zinc finger domain-containing protein [Novosphingobium sp.]|nr:CHC2 zinc finger domain-containing protein [Novosphingobium sp.]
MNVLFDLDAIRRDNPLPDVAARIVSLKAAGGEWKACCPFHADRSPSFTIFDGGRRFKCFGCGLSGDVLDFVQRAHGVNLPEAARMLGAGEVPKIALPCVPLANADAAASRVRVISIWESTVPAAGSLAESYLGFRGIVPPFPPDIRFARLSCGSRGQMPCLVAAVRDVAGDVTGIQRIFLRDDGLGKADMPKPKLSLGAVKGGAIRLGDLDGSDSVTVCEGPEDGLSLLAMEAGPVWAAAGATFLPHMQFPPEVRSIVIGADNDPAGAQAADNAAHAFAERGLTVRIIRPLPGFKDFNDELKGVRA